MGLDTIEDGGRTGVEVAAEIRRRQQLVRSQLTIERSTDAAAIREILTHPRVFPWVTDDSSPCRAEFEPPMHPSVIWLLARQNSKPIGLGGFFPRSGCTLETHISFLPEAYGPTAFEAFRRMREWIRTNTQFPRLIGEIPRSNRLSIHFAQRSGFRPYAVNRKSILRKGEREDQICLELELV